MRTTCRAAVKGSLLERPTHAHFHWGSLDDDITWAHDLGATADKTASSVHKYSVGTNGNKCMDQPCKVANPTRGQLNRENISCPHLRLRIWSRETVSAVPSRVSLLISILRLIMVHNKGIPPEFRGGVHLFI